MTVRYIVICLLGFSMVTHASGDRLIEEVIVTADQVEKSAQDTAIAITAISDDAIEKFGMDDPEDIALFVPSFSRTEFDFTIRGVGRNWRGLGGDPGVTTYLNGVYAEDMLVGWNQGNLYDVRRIEILRGPQGTLFGQSSIAGAVNVISNPPSSAFDAEFIAGFGDYNTEKYMGYISGPIIPELINGRVTATRSRQAGDRESLAAPGQTPVSDTGGGRDSTITLALDIIPTENTEVFIRAQHRELDSSPRALLHVGEGSGDRRSRSSAVCFPEGYECYVEAVPVFGSTMPKHNSAANIDLPISGNGFGDNLDNWAYPDSMPFEDLDSDYVSLDLKWHFGYDRFTLRYLTGYSDFNYQRDLPWNAPGGRNHCLPPDCSPGPGGEQFREDHWFLEQDQHSYSHELQLITNLDGPLNFVGGLFHYTASKTQFWDFFDTKLFGAYITPPAPNLIGSIFGPPLQPGKDNSLAPSQSIVGDFGGTPNGSYLWMFAEEDRTSYASYARLIWSVTENLKLTSGARWSKDKKEGVEHLWAVFEFELGPLDVYNDLLTTDPVTGEYNGNPLRLIGERGSYKRRTIVTDDWQATTWRVNLDWQPAEDFLSYLTISTGHRPGGLGLGYGQLFGFEEEKVIAYELGFKVDTWEKRLRLNIAAYAYDYENYQIADMQPVSCDQTIECDTPLESANQETVQNVPESIVRGIELESQIALTPRFTFGAMYSYMKTRVTDDWIISKENNDLADSFDSISVNAKGSELTRAPKHKYTFWGNYNVPLGDRGTLDLLTLFAYTGEQYQHSLNVRINQAPSFTRWDARVSWVSPTRKYRASAYVHNINNDLGIISMDTYQNFGRRAQTTAPRTWGLEFRMQFGAQPGT